MLKTFIHATMMATLLSVAIVAFAEEAPVYDADNLPRQFDGQMDSMAAAPTGATPSGYDSGYAPAPAAPRSFNNNSNDKVARLEQQLNNLKTLPPRIESLQSEVQTLRGQVEELTHQLQQAQNQQRAMYSELDKRLANNSVKTVAANNAADDAVSTAPDEVIQKPVKTKKPAAVAKEKDENKSVDAAETAVSKSSDTQPNVAEEQQTYQTAYNLIKAKKYNEAVTNLQKMLQKYPSGQFAANAHYWLGELYGLMNKDEQSAAEFATVVRKYPDSPKVSEAQVKLGLIYVSQSKWSEAKALFKKVISKYPSTTSAQLAQEQLKQIKIAGH